MLDGDGQLLTDLAAPREDRVGSLDADTDVTADELEVPVRPEHPGEQSDLAKDLEAVADPEHGPPSAANRRTASMTGATLAIAPHLR